jgi:hypothetical protein
VAQTKFKWARDYPRDPALLQRLETDQLPALSIANGRLLKSQTAPDRADIWLSHLTTLFNDEAVVSVGFWSTLTINRTAPLDLSYNGVGFDVVVEPTDEDIDTLLPIRQQFPASGK